MLLGANPVGGRWWPREQRCSPAPSSPFFLGAARLPDPSRLPSDSSGARQHPIGRLQVAAASEPAAAESSSGSRASWAHARFSRAQFHDHADSAASGGAGEVERAHMLQTAATLYDLLGIPRNGSQAEIRDAYRQLARRYHPDVRPAGISVEESTHMFIQVQEAYEILSDPQRRATYDFEMMHGRSHSRPRPGYGGSHARATWRPRRRGEEEPPLWVTMEEEMSVKEGWRQQWEQQMRGFQQHRATQPKPGSWAARMRQQQQEQQ